MVEQRTLGLIVVLISSFLYVYYTVWMLITPSIDEDHTIQGYFPDRMYGVLIPTLIGYLAIAGAMTIAGMILINDNKQGSSPMPRMNHSPEKQPSHLRKNYNMEEAQPTKGK